MAINREEAFALAVDHLSSNMKHRLEIVERISGCLYATDNLDVKNSWIIYVQTEEPSSYLQNPAFCHFDPHLGGETEGRNLFNAIHQPEQFSTIPTLAE